MIQIVFLSVASYDLCCITIMILRYNVKISYRHQDLIIKAFKELNIMVFMIILMKKGAAI